MSALNQVSWEVCSPAPSITLGLRGQRASSASDTVSLVTLGKSSSNSQTLIALSCKMRSLLSNSHVKIMDEKVL